MVLLAIQVVLLMAVVYLIAWIFKRSPATTSLRCGGAYLAASLLLLLALSQDKVWRRRPR